MFSIKSTFSILLIDLAFRLCLASRVTFSIPSQTGCESSDELVFLSFSFQCAAAAISLFTACSTRHCGTSACCLRWRWEGSLLCLRVGFSFLCGSAGGWAESLSCYFLTSFATSFGRRSARRGFKNRKLIGEVGCCESRMAERSHWWTESSKARRVSKAKKVSGPKRQAFLNPRNMNGRTQL